MYFIDRLDVYQDHINGGLPVVGKILHSKHDLETGELISENPNPKPLEGSFSTKLQIRCDGVRVSIEGNPSRWNRIDNLFGFTTFDECIAVYNIELLKLGLPPFSKTTKVSYYQTGIDSKLKRMTDGASFRRVDMTRNLSVGLKNEQPFLRGLSGQRIGKGIMPRLHADQNTLEWSSHSWYHKLYNKAVEMQLPKYRKFAKNLSTQDSEYRNKIINFCEEIGLIRDEKEFKQSFLNRYDLCSYGFVRENDFLKYLTDIDKLLNKIEISTMDYIHISDILIQNNICKSRQSANATQSYLFAWLYGQPIDKNKRQYYEHKRRLLCLGIDISIPHDETKLMPQLRNNREINVSTLLPPDWYKMPSVNNLRLVA